MSWRCTALSILTLLAFVAIRLLPSLSPPPEVDPSWFLPPSYDDPEGRLAMGHKLPLQCANIFSLELVKGVSDTLAAELLTSRFDIIGHARTGSPIDAIQRAKGVGEATAERLLRYIDLTERCTSAGNLTMWRKGERTIPRIEDRDTDSG